MARSTTKEPAILTPGEITSALADLSHAEIQRLSALSGTPVPTLWNIRSGKTGNPGLATVLAFWRHISAAKAS